MPEHEIAKHGKEIYKAITSREKNWKHRLGDILIEILIIVFAITLSLFVERWREHLKDKKIEKQFLIGLKKDLQNDIIQLQEDSISYSHIHNGWTYFRLAGINEEAVNKDSATKYIRTLFSTIDFLPNDSRFEALKSSGELGTIENDSLQNLILDLYQSKIRSMKASTTSFTNFHNSAITPFLSENYRIQKDGTTNFPELLKNPRLQNYLLVASGTGEIIFRYHNVIAQSRQIIEMINKQYDLKD